MSDLKRRVAAAFACGVFEGAGIVVGVVFMVKFMGGGL